MKITLEPIGEVHYTRLLELFNEFVHFQKKPESMCNNIEKMQRDKSLIKGYVAIADDKIVGYTTCFYAYFTWSGKALYLDDLYVQPHFRGKGIGKALINKVIEFARATACFKVHWQVSGWNTSAIAFYKSLGATVDGTEHNCDLLL